MTVNGCFGLQMKNKLRWCFMPLLLSLAIVSFPVHSDDMAVGVKAAFLYNFTKFVRWPESAFSGDKDDLVLCVSAPLQAANIVGQTVQEKRVQGRSIDYRYVTERIALRGCHVWFVTAEYADRHAQWFAETPSLPLLIVGDGDQFVDKVGTIGLLIIDGRIRFAINERRAAASGLHISSKLLSLAQRVVR